MKSCAGWTLTLRFDFAQRMPSPASTPLSTGEGNNTRRSKRLNLLATDHQKHVLEVVAAADTIGARAVLVHAVDEQARRFYEHFSFERSPVAEFELMLLMKDLRASLRAN